MTTATTTTTSSSTCSGTPPTVVAEYDDSPIQVFIMLGQSNMLGMGAVEGPDKPGTLEYLIERQQQQQGRGSGNNYDKYARLKDPESGDWKQSDHVRYVQTMHKNGNMGVLRNEWLTVKPKARFGPELGFGNVVGPHYSATTAGSDDNDNQRKPRRRVLLLKACIGNRSLGWDLLPPGSPRYELDGTIYAGYKESPSSWPEGTTKPEPIQWYAGKQYDDDVASCKRVLANIGDYYPGATAGDYQVAGFVWWQGHKDQNAAHASKYEENLVRLIRSLREDFDAPRAKFVCATVAFDGYRMRGHLSTIANAQLAVSGEDSGWTKYPDFRDNVSTIDARPFWRDHDQSPVQQGHHYHQNAETFYEVGHALGEAMVELLKKEEQKEEEEEETTCAVK